MNGTSPLKDVSKAEIGKEKENVVPKVHVEPVEGKANRRCRVAIDETTMAKMIQTVHRRPNISKA